MDGKVNIRLTIHQVLHFLLLFLLLAAQPVSKFMMSGMEILLAANWLIMMLGNVVERWLCGCRAVADEAREGHWLLVAFVVLMVVHLVWMLPTENTAYGWQDIFKKLPLIAIPLVVLTTRPLNRRQLAVVFLGFVTSVFVATIIGRVRLHTIAELPYRQIIPFISHIRFSMNVCLALLLLAWYAVDRIGAKGWRWGDWQIWMVVLIGVSFVDFLLKLRSYTAFVMLFVVAVVLLAAYGRRIRPRGILVVLWSLLALAVVSVAAVSVYMIRDFYKPVAMVSAPLAECTASGNPYTHACDGLMENGNYVNNYICNEELGREWDKRSTISLDDTANGYAVYSTLVRYLNAIGTTKDSVGISKLTDTDIEAIEKGVANPVYLYGSQLRKMYYVMLFEYESYRKLHAVKNFTMLQRFELWGNAWKVFKAHPLFGVGTGDVVDECHRQLAADESPLYDTTKHAHNQYLTFLVTFGIVGFLLIAAVFVWALRKERILQLPAATAFVVIVLVSFITEDTLETLAGCVFSVLFLCLLSRSLKYFISSKDYNP